MDEHQMMLSGEKLNDHCIVRLAFAPDACWWWHHQEIGNTTPNRPQSPEAATTFETQSVEVFGQKKSPGPFPGIAHKSSLFWGFIVLGITVVESLRRALAIENFFFPIIGQ